MVPVLELSLSVPPCLMVQDPEVRLDKLLWRQQTVAQMSQL